VQQCMYFKVKYIQHIMPHKILKKLSANSRCLNTIKSTVKHVTLIPQFCNA